MMPQRYDCEILIIGSGAGGASVADVLTKAGRDVLMIEEGPDSTGTPATARATLPKLWRNAGLTMALGKNSVAYAEGRCVGGGTQINSGIFQRTPPELLENWAKKYALADFSAESLAPYYERAEKMVEMKPAPAELGEDSSILRRAAISQHWQCSALDQAALGMDGAPRTSLAHAPSEDFSTTTALLPAACARGMRLMSNCKAQRLEVNLGRITRVQALHNGQPIHIRARHVFLCAGAIYTPFLLQKSGMRSKQIGAGLQMHPTLKLLAFFDKDVNASATRLPRYAVTEFMPRLRFGGSVFTPAFYGMALAENWQARGAHIDDANRAAMYYAMVKPQGTGSVHALPLLPDPVVRFNLAPQDAQAIADGAAKLAGALFAAGARKVYPSLRGHEGWNNAGEASPLAARGIKTGEANLMSVHLFSSCKPGENDFCVTDSFGNLHGIKNLTLADASQIPDAPGVNPQATVMALALRNAENFLSRRA
jgi:choline dehydrogenase-like flavoprotein